VKNVPRPWGEPQVSRSATDREGCGSAYPAGLPAGLGSEAFANRATAGHEHGIKVARELVHLAQIGAARSPETGPFQAVYDLLAARLAEMLSSSAATTNAAHAKDRIEAIEGELSVLAKESGDTAGKKAEALTVALGCEIELLRHVVGAAGESAPHVRP